MKSRSLFHYTTAQGLLGIIKDQALFATHADFSNDSSECKLIRAYIANVLSSEYKELVPQLIDMKIIDPDLLRMHGILVFEKEADNSVNAMLRATNNTAPYFVTSFCIHDDKSYEYSHGLLSQWRGYGLGGFAIEFDELEIDKLIEAELAGWKYQGILSNTVAYEDHEQHADPSRFKGMAGAFLREILPKKIPDEDLNKILGTQTIDDYGRHFLSVAPFLKHRGFREESEYRIVALCNRPTKNDPGDERKVKEIHFRSRQDGHVVPYISLFENLDKPLPIKGIIIGPHPQQDNQRGAVELLLERYGVKAPVRVSELPFRT
jgi:hypothetical protein